MSVLLNTLDTKVSIQRGRKHGYALPMKTDKEETTKLKKHRLKDLVLKRINELKPLNKIFSLRSETMIACQAARVFRNAPRHLN